MNIVCGQCGAGVVYESPSLSSQTVVVCSACGSRSKVTIEVIGVPVAAETPSPGPTAATRQTAVVAVQGEATREVIGELLTSAGFTVTEVTSGSEALAKVGTLRPVLVLVDVGFSDMPGFQVCEAVRKDAANSGVKMILIAAIHNKDRYRRPPDKLYGADDYIERHQIESELLNKVKRLCGVGTRGDDEHAVAARAPEPERPVTPAAPPASRSVAVPSVTSVEAVREPTPRPSLESPPTTAQVPPDPRAATPAPADVRPPVATAPVKEVAGASSPAPATPVSPAQEAALRLARIIVSDIALYNAKKVDEGVASGTFFDLLRAEIEEGRKLYEERKGSGLTTTVDLFQQTLEQFVATRRELLKRNRPAAA
jgi:CheY-like chemotaxis protein